MAGYDVIPIAQIEKSERAEATPQLDATYIPPLLACDAWHELSVGVLQAVYDRIGRKIEKLAGQAVSRGLSLDSIAPGDALIFAQLRELNEAYAILTNIAFLEGVHPLVGLPGAVPAGRAALGLQPGPPAPGHPALRPRRPGGLLLHGSRTISTTCCRSSPSPTTRNARSSATACGCRSRSSGPGSTRTPSFTSACAVRSSPTPASS